MANETIPTHARAAMLVCVPLTWLDCARVALSRALPGRAAAERPEFLRRAVCSLGSRGQYLRRVGREAKVLVRAIRRLGARVSVRAMFEDFVDELGHSGTDIVFLLAHHRDDHRIEFWDRAVDWDDMIGTVGAAWRIRPVAVVWIVCEAAASVSRLVPREREMGAFAVAAYEMPMPNAMWFAALWLEALDGRHTIAQAQQVAIERFVRP